MKLKTCLLVGLATTLVGCGTNHYRASNEGAMNAQVAQAQEETSAVSTVTANDFKFGFDSAALTEESQLALDQYAEFLTEHPDMKVRVEGYTDQRGRQSYNVGLGERRAKSVVDYLAARGIDKDRIDMKSFGAKNLVDPSDTEEAYAKNRRVEVFFESTSETV